MGLIRAAVSATRSVMTEQWKEFFMCEGISPDIMMVRGVKITGDKSQNIKSDDNVISDGSVIAVADGQSAIIVSQGKITDVFDEPGEHVLHDGAASVLGGSGVKPVGKEIIKRIGFGGDVPATTQRIYYVNRKEIPNNPFKLVAPFRICDENLGLDMDADLEASGVFSFKISDPVLVYKTLIGNVESTYRTAWFIEQLTTDVKSIFYKILAEYSSVGCRPSEVEEFIQKIADRLTSEVSAGLLEKRGIEIVSLAFSSFKVAEMDAMLLRTMQKNKVLTDPAMAAATLSSAQSEAMELAADWRK